MSIQSLNSTPQINNQINFKQNSQSPKKTSTFKKVALATTGIITVSALTLAAIKLAKSGKININKAINKLKPQKESNFVSKGELTQEFNSPAEMAHAIVEQFNKMKNRQKGFNLKKFIYEHRIDWDSTPLSRAEVLETRRK